MEIKHYPLIVDAPKHLLNMIQRIQDTCTAQEKEVVLRNVQFNAFWLNPECLIWSMLRKWHNVILIIQLCTNYLVKIEMRPIHYTPLYRFKYVPSCSSQYPCAHCRTSLLK